MPVDLNIIESATELDTTVVTVVLESASEPGPAGPGVPAGGTAGQVLTKDSGTDYDTSWQDASGGGPGADDQTAAEVPFTPAGTISATDTQAAVEEVASDAATALSTHEADTTNVHGITDTAALALSANVPSNATFNDHSARHENGGADEINIGGLDGTPTELTNHLNDTSAAHAASAISADSTTLVGTGTDVQAVLEELDNGIADHLADSSAAHAASAISVSSTTLSGTGTDVQAVFEEIDNLLDDHSSRHENGGADEISIAGLDGTPTELTNHLNDTSAAHAASAISADSTTLVGTGTDVQAVLEELDNGIADHLADATDAHAGTAITNTPAGTVSATTVQAAINELDSEKTTAAAALSAAQTEIADQKRLVAILVSDPGGSAITTGDGKALFRVPTLLNGHNLVAVAASVSTVSSSGTPTIQLRRLRLTNATTQSAADMLSTRITIDASEFDSKDAASSAVIDTSNDDVATGDQINVDIDVAGTGTKGLMVEMTFEAP